MVACIEIIHKYANCVVSVSIVWRAVWLLPSSDGVFNVNCTMYDVHTHRSHSILMTHIFHSESKTWWLNGSFTFYEERRNMNQFHLQGPFCQNEFKSKFIQLRWNVNYFKLKWIYSIQFGHRESCNFKMCRNIRSLAKKIINKHDTAQPFHFG